HARAQLEERLPQRLDAVLPRLRAWTDDAVFLHALVLRGDAERLSDRHSVAWTRPDRRRNQPRGTGAGAGDPDREPLKSRLLATRPRSFDLRMFGVVGRGVAFALEWRVLCAPSVSKRSRPFDASIRKRACSFCASSLGSARWPSSP